MLHILNEKELPNIFQWPQRQELHRLPHELFLLLISASTKDELSTNMPHLQIVLADPHQKPACHCL